MWGHACRDHKSDDGREFWNVLWHNNLTVAAFACDATKLFVHSVGSINALRFTFMGLNQYEVMDSHMLGTATRIYRLSDAMPTWYSEQLAYLLQRLHRFPRVSAPCWTTR